MDSHLGALTHPAAEKVTRTARKAMEEIMRPLLVAIPDSAELSFEEAAKLLRMRSKPKNTSPTAGLEEAEESLLKNEIPVEIKSSSPYEKSRSKFIFVDIGHGPQQSLDHVLTRDRDGQLRTASGMERLLAIKRIWGSEFRRAWPRLK